MSDDFTDSADPAAYQAQDEQVWPENCSECGTELQTAVVGWDGVGTEGEWPEEHSPGSTVTRDFCPNPDCPAKVSDLAPAADPVEGARLTQAVEGEDPDGR